ncbi:MAG: hypothetical protein Q9178_005563 [Gyalolechia marmorata]
MFASSFLSGLTSSAPQPLFSFSSTQASPAPFTDIFQSPTDTTATLLAIARQEAHLESHIQYLLDIQSDRLLEGLGNDAAAPSKSRSLPKTVHDNDSPTTRPRVAAAAAAAAQEPNLTLQGARQEIRTAISDLHALKQQNADLVATDLQTATREVEYITALQTKKSKLESAIHEMETSDRSAELDALAKEEEMLGRKIHDLENQLFEMRGRLRVVRQGLREGRNREEAEVSSFRGSLELVGREEREVLEGGRRKRKTVLGAVTGKGGKGKGEGVWDLPPKRRTLAMVGEFYDGEREVLRKKLEGVENESRALEEGGRVWDDVVREVGNVERMLESQMNVGLHNDNNRAGWDDRDRERGRGDGIRSVLEAMAHAREKIGEKLKLAESKGWNLLVVCVGAELEALVEGEEVLRGVLGLEGGVGDGEGSVGVGAGNNGSSGGGGKATELNDFRGLDMMHGDKGMVEDTDDDDEPGPELLLSMQEDDIGQHKT